MRIKLLKIKEYKNLKELKIKFISENIDVIIGNNGSGKTNLYEFILNVFQSLTSKNRLFDYEFILDYEIETLGQNKFVSLMGDGTEITAKVNGEAIYNPVFPKEFIPKNIIIYYSGTSKKLKSLYSSSFLHIKDSYFPLIFISLLTSSLERNRVFLKEYFNINTTRVSNIKLKIKNFYQLEEYFSKDDIENRKDELKYIRDIEKSIIDDPIESSSFTRFEHYKEEIKNVFSINKFTDLKLKRIDFLQSLIRYSKHLQFTEDNNYLEVELESNRNESDGAVEYDYEFIKRLIEVENVNLIKVNDIEFYKNNIADKLSYKDLSEGETQFILVQGIIELFNDNENLFLLDEPDTYLHPKWQRKIIGNLRESNSESTHVLFTTHSPQTLSLVTSKNIYIIKKDTNGLTEVYNPSKSIFGRDINSIISEAMDIPDRPKEIHDLFDKYFEYIAKNEFDNVEKVKQEILDIVSGEESYFEDEVLFLKGEAIISRKKMLQK